MAEKKTRKPKQEKEIKLEDILFNCRDILRGKASMSIRRDTILTLVFIKFVSDRFHQQRKALEIEHADKPKELRDLLLKNQDSYMKAGVFYIDEDCYWSKIVEDKSTSLATDLDNIISKLDNLTGLKDVLPPKIFTNGKIENKILISLISEIDKISDQTFNEKDLIGRVYEYFLQAFSMNADKEEGEFYTPHSIVELIANLIEPYKGIVYDPCCGAGGMFVECKKFVEEHGGNTHSINVYGQESDPDTYRLAKMNIAIRGISYDLGTTNASTFSNDQHPGLKAEYIMANPPFNLKKWREGGFDDHDPRWKGYEQLPPESNANYAWILHMISKLDETSGVAGFLLANGALDDSDAALIRKKIIEDDKVEAIIVLPREMFYSTDISVTLWILNQNKKGGPYHGRNLRNRQNEILFVDLRTWNQNIYEKKFVQFSEQQIADIKKIYTDFQTVAEPGSYAKPELYYTATLSEIAQKNYSLVPSRYIEFVDRDTEIDFQAALRTSGKTVSELLRLQEQNRKDLINAFKVIGYDAE